MRNAPVGENSVKTSAFAEKSGPPGLRRKRSRAGKRRRSRDGVKAQVERVRNDPAFLRRDGKKNAAQLRLAVRQRNRAQASDARRDFFRQTRGKLRIGGKSRVRNLRRGAEPLRPAEYFFGKFVARVERQRFRFRAQRPARENFRRRRPNRKTLFRGNLFGARFFEKIDAADERGNVDRHRFVPVRRNLSGNRSGAQDLPQFRAAQRGGKRSRQGADAGGKRLRAVRPGNVGKSAEIRHSRAVFPEKEMARSREFSENGEFRAGELELRSAELDFAVTTAGNQRT